MEISSAEKRKVCIVDDEEDIREIYSVAFSQSGYEVVTARDGEEGLKVVREQKPDIALVDIMMPKMDGLEMIREMKKDPELAKVPIIVMTNIDDRKITAKAGKMDVYFYLVKSLFDPKKVVATVEEVLHNK